MRLIYFLFLTLIATSQVTYATNDISRDVTFQVGQEQYVTAIRYCDKQGVGADTISNYSIRTVPGFADMFVLNGKATADLTRRKQDTHAIYSLITSDGRVYNGEIKQDIKLKDGVFQYEGTTLLGKDQHLPFSLKIKCSR